MKKTKEKKIKELVEEIEGLRQDIHTLWVKIDTTCVKVIEHEDKCAWHKNLPHWVGHCLYCCPQCGGGTSL